MLAGRFKIRHKRYVNVKRVFLADFVSDLTYRLYIRLTFNISRRAADFGYDDVRRRLFADRIYKTLDFVCNVRNYLNGISEVFSPALL